MGRIRNVLNKLSDDKNLKGRELTDIIVCFAFQDGHIHAAYPSDKVKTAQMLQQMIEERGLHCLLKK
jgi:hypothetical protein